MALLSWWPASFLPYISVWGWKNSSAEESLPWDRRETGNLQFIKWTGPSWVILVPDLFLSKLPNFATLFDCFLYPNSCLYHSYWTCELQLDWVAHGNRDLTLSVLVSVRAFLYCWLQILLGGIRQLLELGGKISKGESCELQEPPSDGTKSCLDTLLPSSRVKALALHSV